MNIRICLNNVDEQKKLLTVQSKSFPVSLSLYVIRTKIILLLNHAF